MGHDSVAIKIEHDTSKPEMSRWRQLRWALTKPPSHLAMALLCFTPIGRLVFPLAQAALRRTQPGQIPSRRLLQALWLGWGNPYYPAVEYLEKMIELIDATEEGGSLNAEVA